eukprot:7169907-Pyramimonas_sp.AAC.1
MAAGLATKTAPRITAFTFTNAGTRIVTVGVLSFPRCLRPSCLNSQEISCVRHLASKFPTVVSAAVASKTAQKGDTPRALPGLNWARGLWMMYFDRSSQMS